MSPEYSLFPSSSLLCAFSYASQMCSINIGSANFQGITIVIAFLLYKGVKVPDL